MSGRVEPTIGPRGGWYASGDAIPVHADRQVAFHIERPQPVLGALPACP